MAPGVTKQRSKTSSKAFCVKLLQSSPIREPAVNSNVSCLGSSRGGTMPAGLARFHLEDRDAEHDLPYRLPELLDCMLLDNLDMVSVRCCSTVLLGRTVGSTKCIVTQCLSRSE